MMVHQRHLLLLLSLATTACHHLVSALTDEEIRALPTIPPRKYFKEPETRGALPDLDPVTAPLAKKPQGAGEKYKYGQLLHMSYLFYETQRSGKLPASNRISYRGDSALKDGSDVGLDLTGGWYDAGDHVKFNFPMAWSTTVLNWGIIEYWDAYEASGELDNALDGVKWPLDYFIKANPDPNTYYCQVGDGNGDHSYWGPPENMNMRRPSFKSNGAEPIAEASAALASGFLVFKDIDAGYADNLLNHAMDLYDLALKNQQRFTISQPFYASNDGFLDELAWAAVWLYAATGDEYYLGQAKGHYQNCCSYTGNSGFSWDSKAAGVQLMLYIVTRDDSYAKGFGDYMKGWMSMRTTPKGLAFYNQWGPNRYAANSAFLALLAADFGIDSDRNRAWGKKQIHYILGDCCGGVDPKSGLPYFSYVVGYGNNFPRAAHHRSSSCSGPGQCDCSRRPHPHILYGALVGGPDQGDGYIDDCTDYVRNEVATDYNAGFTSAVAGLKHLSITGQLRYLEEEEDQHPKVNNIKTGNLGGR